MGYGLRPTAVALVTLPQTLNGRGLGAMRHIKRRRLRESASGGQSRMVGRPLPVEVDAFGPGSLLALPATGPRQRPVIDQDPASGAPR